MKILYISNDDSGGNNFFTSQAVKRHTRHETRAAKMMQSYLQYPTEIYQPSINEIKELMEWADVIHIRNGWEFLPKGYEHKPTVITFTNMSYRNIPDYYTRLCGRYGWLVTVSTIDLMKFQGALWMPNSRPDMLGDYQKYDRFTVCQAPTKRDRKGTRTVIRAVSRLPNVDLVLIENTTYSDCLEIRKHCHLTIDQFTYGYGNSSIEAWAMGMPVISWAGIAPDVPDYIEARMDLLPWCDTSEDVGEIVENIKCLMDPQCYEEVASRGRVWYERHHTERAVAARAVELYERVLDEVA